MVIDGCPYKENQKERAWETGLSTTVSQISTIGVDAQITEDNKLEIEVNGKSSLVAIPASGKQLSTKPITDFITSTPGTIQVLKEFDIEYILMTDNDLNIGRTTVSKTNATFSKGSHYAYLGTCLLRAEATKSYGYIQNINFDSIVKIFDENMESSLNPIQLTDVTIPIASSTEVKAFYRLYE